MAVEIPVYVNITKGFDAAAAQIPKEMPKLEKAISKNVLSIPVYLRGGYKTVQDALISTKITAKDLKQVLQDITYQFERQSKLEADKSRTSTQVKNLAKAYGLVEQRLTGVYNGASSAAMMVTNTINKVQAKIRQFQAQLSTTPPGSKAFDDINYKIKVQEDRLRKLNLQYEQYRVAALRSSNTVAASMDKTNNSLSRQNRLLQSVSSLAASYISIWQAVNFIRNIRETTAEFEMQRVALAGIIQDTEQANSLFRQIKAAALQSPFQIKDLVKDVKQLSAYRIETDKLFDVTTRLADVSAGLGVDMNRLILAYGQVRAASVLRGQELRQFTEAGVPLVDELAKKFTELNGRMTSTAEVFELISKRAVPFSMIEEIFNDMTEAGGTFYKMQERQAETLAGQWANLKDALSIMYDEIGNTPEVHNAMEDLISSAKVLMNNWRQVATIIGVVGQGYVALKIASLFMPKLAYNTELAEKATVALARASALEAKQQERANIVRAITIRSLKDYATVTKYAAAAQTSFGRGFLRLGAFLAGGGWISIAVTAVTILTGWLISAHKEANRLKNELTKIGTEGDLALNRSVSNFNRLADAAVNAADGSEEQNKAIAELKRTYGDIIPVEELQVDKLRTLQGSYQSLTKAIEEKINMQIKEQKINAIQDSFSTKITKANKSAQRLLMQYGLDKDQIRAVLREVQSAIDGGLLDINSSVAARSRFFADTIKRLTGITVDFGNGFRDYAGEWHRVDDVQDKTRDSLLKIVDLYLNLHTETAQIENDMDSLIGSMGRYANSWKELENKLKTVSLDEKVFGRSNTFAYKEEVLRERIRRMSSAIEDAFKDTGIDISQAFKVPERIDFKFLSEASKQAAASGNWGIDSFVAKIQKKYEGLIPSDEFTNALKVKFGDIAKSVGISMDDVQGYLKKGDEDIRKYTKGIQESLQEAKDKLVEMQKRNELAKEHSVVVPVSDEDLDKQGKIVDFFEALLKYLDEFVKHNKGPRDTRLSQLKSDISELTNAYKKFKELTKYKGEESALSDINKLFPQLEGWTPTKDNLVKRLNEMLDKVKSDLARSPKSKTLLDMKRALETEISNLEFDDLKDKIETKLKNLQDEIKRSETARNFFNDILDLTGDEKLATTMSIEVYGGLGSNFKERLQHQLDTILESLDASKITDELRDAFAKQNFSVIMANLDKIPEAWHKELKDMADRSQKFSADQIQTWLKELQKVKTYAEQRVEIERKAQRRISEIRASDIDQATKSDLIAQYQRKQAEDVAKAQYEAFKNSPLYVQMFDSLDNASERVLRLMRERIAEMMASWKDLDPVQLKEMQSRLNEIDKQLANRNPFKVLSDSIKRYNDLMKSGRSRLGDETAAVEADAELKKQKELLETELKKLTAKRANLDATRKYKSANQGAVLAAEYEVKIQENVVEEQQENVNLAEKAANETARQADEWKDIADLIGASSKAFQEYYGIFEQLEETIEQAFSIFLTDELADKVRRTKDIINSLTNAIQSIAKAAASASAGEVGGAVSSGFSGFFNIVSVGMQIADMIGQIKLDEWNKQIETQDRLIQALERSYSRLENVMNKSFGADYIYNYTEAVNALEAAQEAYNKQLETSKEKEKEASKQEDREAAAQQSAQIEQNIQDTSKKLSELEEQMQEFYTGSSLSAAAQEFASAWLEAYREFGSTSEAIKERMQDMINNLIVKASLAKVAEQILSPFYKAITDSAKAGTMTEDISMLIDMLNGKVGELNTGLNAMGQVLQSAGISLRGTVGSFRGISRDIAGASEEAILGLSAGINTQNFYMSAIHEDVSRIAAMLLGETESTNNAVPPTSASSGAEMKTVQELANIHLPHMDSTLSSIYELLTRVIKANGTTATHYVSVRM